MLTNSEIRKAVEMECETHPVLSVSLNVDPHVRSPEQYRLAFRSLLEQAEGKGARAQDLKRAQDFLDLEYDRSGRGVIMYSCAAEDFWWVNTFLPPVEDGVNVGRRSAVRELAKLMDTYERYGVIHVEQTGARLFSFHLGLLEDATDVVGDDIKVQHTSERRVQKQAADKARQNLQAAAELAERFYGNNNTKRLILAGTEKNVAKFRDLLSTKLQKMLVGRIAADANAGHAEIREKALTLAREAADEQATVEADSVVTLSHKGGNAVTGLSETLTALQHGRAQHIVTLSDFAHPAYRFVDSGIVLLELTEDSDLVSGRVQKLPDAVDSVLRRAMEQGIGVSILAQHAQLEQAGRIGALTRY